MVILLLLSLPFLLYGLSALRQGGRDVLWELHSSYFRLHGVHETERTTEWEHNQIIIGRISIIVGGVLLLFGWGFA
ncbi:MAG: hypothetical protein D6737_01660 [Chloroflexi bacterium]|nr:MAG: hypothetical protein D6737_01660 [Chloroflexota bacterium]